MLYLGFIVKTDWMGPFLLFVTLIMGFRSEQLLLFSDSMSMERYFPVDTLPELKTELVRSYSVNWTAWSYPCSVSCSYNISSSDWSYISSTWNCFEDSFLFGVVFSVWVIDVCGTTVSFCFNLFFSLFLSILG